MNWITVNLTLKSIKFLGKTHSDKLKLNRSNRFLRSLLVASLELLEGKKAVEVVESKKKAVQMVQRSQLLLWMFPIFTDLRPKSAWRSFSRQIGLHHRPSRHLSLLKVTARTRCSIRPNLYQYPKDLKMHKLKNDQVPRRMKTLKKTQV